MSTQLKRLSTHLGFIECIHNMGITYLLTRCYICMNSKQKDNADQN